MKKFYILCGFFLMTGWFSIPVIMRYTSGGCVSYTTLIYDEPTRTIVSSARWDMTAGGEHLFYSSAINDNPLNGEGRGFVSERTINAQFRYHADSMTVRTVSAFRIAGPETSDPEYGRYIDPPAEQGFSARVYTYYAGGRIMMGFRNLPISVCRN